MKRKAVNQVAVAIVAAGLAGTAVAQVVAQRPQGRSGTTYYRNANGSSAGTATTPGR